VKTDNLNSTAGQSDRSAGNGGAATPPDHDFLQGLYATERRAALAVGETINGMQRQGKTRVLNSHRPLNYAPIYEICPSELHRRVAVGAVAWF